MNSDDENNAGDGEGVWSPDIEQCFQEALLIYPPCGRRKHILPGEGGGKMYGRNELIAQFIYMRTGKKRTRKQVSSHIQVLARRKAKSDITSNGDSMTPTHDGSLPSHHSLVVNGHANNNNTHNNHNGNLLSLASSLDPSSAPSSTTNSTGSPTSSSTTSVFASNNILLSASSQQQQQQQLLNNNHHSNSTPHLNRHHLIHSMAASSELANSTASQYLQSHQIQSRHQHQQQQQQTQLNLQHQHLHQHQQLTHQHQQHLQHQQLLLPHQQQVQSDAWIDREIATAKMRLIEFSAFLEQRYSPDLSSATSPLSPIMLSASSTNGFHRHNYVQLDYRLRSRQPSSQINRQTTSPPTPASVLTGAQTPVSNQNSLPLVATNNGSAGTIAPTVINGIANTATPLTATTTTTALPTTTTTNTTTTTIPTNPLKLESIEVNQIHDKFPDLAGPNGLIRRGQADAFYLIKFWADLNTDHEFNLQDQNSFHGFTSQFETRHLFEDLICSTKACSYGLMAVEKVERIHPTYDSSDGYYRYSTSKSPMCSFLEQFIKKLHQLPKKQQMNSVLENFTVLQVITSESTGEVFLCLAFVFEISSSQENGPQYHIYRLT